MPIKSLMTSKPGLSGLPRLGKLRKGAAKEQGKAPRDLSFFRMTFDKEYAYLAKPWERMYGTSPEFFDPVRVAGSTTDEVFSFYLEEWTATTLIRRCDEEMQVRHYVPASDTWSDEPIACVRACEGCACKQVGRLNLMFLEFMRETGALGYITVETHSKNDIVEMHEKLTSYEEMFGSLNGVQFKFGRAPEEISRPKDAKTGKRGRITKSLFYLFTSESYTKREVFGLLSGDRPAALLPERTPLTAEQIDVARQRLGNGGPRRIGAGPATRTPALPDVDDDVSEGDYEESDESGLQGPPWTQADVNVFLTKCHEQTISDREALTALGVTRWGEWQGSLHEAYTAVEAWLNEQQPVSQD